MAATPPPSQPRPRAPLTILSPTQQKTHKIRITLTSRKVKSLEKVCSELLERAKSKDLPVKGPVRLPTKNLKITTRKTPCGEGSKTWDLYEMRIHKRLIECVYPTYLPAEGEREKGEGETEDRAEANTRSQTV